jgi:anti-sigma-K factor RskA
VTHSEMDELYELYLLGILETDEAAQISQHLSEQCEYCLARLKDGSAVVGSLSGLVEVTPPPASLRDRVLSIARPLPQPVPLVKRSRWPLAFGLAMAASVALLVWGVIERGTLNDALTRLQDVSRQRNELRAAIEILSESDTRTVSFGQAQATAHGRVFVSRNGGLVFVGSRLPELASGKTFQLWLVPAKGNAQSAGLFKTNPQGLSVNVLAQAINPLDYAAVAVSIEPNGGSPQPTSKPILVVPLA